MTIRQLAVISELTRNLARLSDELQRCVMLERARIARPYGTEPPVSQFRDTGVMLYFR